MARITVTVANRKYYAQLDVKGHDWRDAAVCCIRDRYGKDAEVLEWEFDGDHTHSAIVIAWMPDLGGRIEVFGQARYTE